ncbi:host attachment protein [Marinobacter sp. R17]|uniref:host attachment protein n=1 Tax=Marinobacter sp. R17 TaxID=2484250 RepID=UPI000F4C0978|nr:host attachment protein [Marinobacter sp. R17]ROT98153.1 host attachment protein [Marinobacter sp. R17]
MEKTWIVVADSAHARILATTQRNNVLAEITSLEHEDSRLKEQELVTDKPGRTNDRMGQAQHPMEEPDYRAQEQKAFASNIVETLEEGRQQGRFDHLALVAAPDFLGLLRQSLSKPLSRMVSESVDKNLVDKDEETIRRQVFH